MALLRYVVPRGILGRVDVVVLLVVLENAEDRAWRVVRRMVWMRTVQRGKGCQSAMKRWWVREETTQGECRPMRIVGITKLSVIEAERMRKSMAEMRRTLLAWVPRKGLETGEVRRWMKSHIGTVTV